MALEEFLPFQVFVFLLVISRVGSTILIMPGIGETFINNRIRMSLVAVLALALTPVLTRYMPPEPPNAVMLFVLVFGEVVIGLYFGLVARILLLTLDTTGRVISFAMGLAAAQVFNPALSNQGTLPGFFLTTLGLLFLFVLNLHHMLIAAVVDSYEVFPVGQPLPYDGLSEAMTRVVSGSFEVAIQLAAPFMVVSLVFFTALGLLSRLMPQLQIFIIGLPAQMVMGFLLLSSLVTGIMSLHMQYYVDTIGTYLLGR